MNDTEPIGKGVPVTEREVMALSLFRLAQQKARSFVEWDDAPEWQRDGYRLDADFILTVTARPRDLHPDIREAMAKLTVTAGLDEVHGPYLLVDASALMADENDVSQWLLFPEDDGQWSHGPSGEVAPLGAALWSIAGCYVLVPDPSAVEATDG